MIFLLMNEQDIVPGILFRLPGIQRMSPGIPGHSLVGPTKGNKLVTTVYSTCRPDYLY